MSQQLPAQIDYTSRDYRSLREDLIARVKARVPEWSADDPSDFGVALVEAFAYMGDIMSYYIDRAANESSLSTATRRANVVALARDLGYEPGGYSSATTSVTLVNSADRAISVPQGTVLSAAVDTADLRLNIPFETTQEVTIASNASASVQCVQGLTRRGDEGYGQYLGLSNGTPRQIFEVPDSKVLKETVRVYVFDGINYVPWQRVDQLIEYSPLSRVFSVREGEQDTVFIEFGDGISGLVPSSGHGVYAEYRVTDGVLGNVPAGTITTIDFVPGLSASEIAILNGFLGVINDEQATGGTDPEDIESVRFNASQSYRTNNRAVSLDDFQSLALRVSNVGKASAVSSTPASVLLSVAPYRDAGTAEERPGYLFDEDAEEFVVSEELVDLKSRALAEVQSAAMAGTTVTMIDPVYVPLELTVTVVGIASLRQVDVFRVIKNAIEQRMDYATMPFGATITDSDVVSLINSLGVTRQVTVSTLQRKGTSDTSGDLTAAPDEIFIINNDDLVITVTGGLEAEL